MLFVAGGGSRSRAIGARLIALQSPLKRSRPLTGCRRPQDCIQAIKALAKAADRAFLTQQGEAAMGARLNARQIALAWPPARESASEPSRPSQSRAPL